MSTEENKAVYQRFVEEVINGGNSDIVEELFAPDYVDHNAPPGAPPGLDAVRMVPKMFRGAFPDVHFTIERMVAEGDLVATDVTGRGTNEGPFMGTPASGKHVTWGSKGIFRVSDGKIVEHWGQPDLLALLSQIGALPPEAQLLPPEETDHQARVDEPPDDSHDPAMLERNKATVRKVYDEGFSKGNLDAAYEIVAPDYLDHPPARFFNVPRVGPESLNGAVTTFRDGFPDLTDTVEDLIAEGNWVVARSLWHGTHTGEFVGVAPTGKEVTISGINFFRMGADGMIVERFGSFDAIGMMQQVGLAPSPGGPPH